LLQNLKAPCFHTGWFVFDLPPFLLSLDFCLAPWLTTAQVQAGNSKVTAYVKKTHEQSLIPTDTVLSACLMADVFVMYMSD
jgi:hypothetical protein